MRGQKNIRFLALVFIAHLVFPLSILADTVGTFRDVQGTVLLARSKVDISPKTGDDVQLNDFVSTREKSRTKLALTDETVLTLGQNSRLEITSYLVSREKKAGIISLKSGALHSYIQKKIDSSFEVHTPNSVTGARGTAWVTVAQIVNGMAETDVYVLEGTVTVFNTAIPGQAVTLAAGQSTTVIGFAAPAVPAAFQPAVIQGIMGNLGMSAEAAGAAAGSAITAGTAAGTVPVAVGIGAAIAGGVVAVGGSTGSGGSGITPTHTTTSHH